jgi:hypothetical protein
VSDSRFEARYAPGLGMKYAVRSWIVSAILLAIGVPVTWFTFLGSLQWWVLVLVGLVFAFLLFLTVSAAAGSPAKWGADGRLAIAIDEAGIALPRVGSLAWGEIHAIRIMDAGFVNANLWFRAWEVLTGSSTHRFMTFWVMDGDAVIARTGGAANSARNLHPMDGHPGFDGVWGEGLRSPDWDQTVAAVQRAANDHGITLLGRTS